MGNCQAAETATPAAEIEHPDGKSVRIYCPVAAGNVMASNPGYYVAVVTCAGGGGDETTVKHVRLLQPDDNLRIGHSYRLVSYEDVLKEFGSKKRVRLSRLIQSEKERDGGADEVGNSSPEMFVGPSITGCGGRISGGAWRQGQWKPTLQSIAEQGI